MALGHRQAGIWLIALGIAVNNAAFCYDLFVRGSYVIWMGPKSWTLVVLGIASVLAGLWLLARQASPLHGRDAVGPMPDAGSSSRP